MSKTEDSLKQSPESKETRLGGPNKYYRVLLWAIVAAVVIYLIARNISAFGNILLVALGFGAVVLVHEFGHFIVAKLSDVKVEAFSIGFPPALVGIQRTESGYRVRILPRFSEKEGESDNERLSFTIGKKARASETEYRIGVIPVGGFVKMLGQDDTGPVKNSDDPRSYANKPATTRMAILATGVIFNVISAMLIFMMVFLIGIKLQPAVVGLVVPNSPAALAGLKAGDEVIEIAGERENLDFLNIQVAAALSGRGEEVRLKVKRGNDTLDFAIVAKQTTTLGGEMRLFGIWPPQSLTIAKVSDFRKLRERTGLLPGDRVRSVNGIEVQSHWELIEIVENSLAPEVILSAERTDEAGGLKLVESRIGLKLMSMGTEHIYSMVPRMRIEQVRIKKSFWDKVSAKIRRIAEKVGILRELKSKPFLQSGDIILSVGDVETPTYSEFREVVKKYEDKELPIEVLRRDSDGLEKPCTISVTPRRYADVNEVLIGISFSPLRMFDTEHAVVAKTIDVKDGPAKLEIPRGAVITAVEGTPVSNFYDIIREIRRYPGQRVTIDYRVNDQTAGSVALNVGAGVEPVTVKSTFAEFVPFDDLKRLYKADNPIDAVAMGYQKTVMFITQTYLTLRRLVGRDVSPKSLIGPFGILAASYTIVAERPFVYYMYFLGLISACIAVINFLPLPPLDGGLVVLLLVEKVKGSALSERTQGIIAYTGWVLIAAFFLYVTFNDVVRTFFG